MRRDLTDNEINTLENRVFRLECERSDWRKFRDLIEATITMQSMFGSISESETKKILDQLESIKYL
jgi:uncharacterized protein YpuA (DUF1002 family)